MKARKLNKREQPPLPFYTKGHKEIKGDFEILVGDDVFLFDNGAKKWYYYDTAQGWAGRNSIEFSKQWNGKVRFSRA